MIKKTSIHFLTIIAFFFVSSSSCQNSDIGKPSDIGKIITVSGTINPEEMGVTLSHEHLLVDFIGAESTGNHRWDKDSVVATLLPFLQELKEYNIQTFIDPTPAFLGRDPELLKMISEQSSLQIITNTGYYGARNNLFISKEALSMSAQELANIWIHENENGIEETGIKPGFIKIGVDASDTLSDFHKILINAAALTHKSSGLVIASHTGPEAPAFEQLEILQNNDVSPSSFIWVHAHRGSLEGNIRAAKMGAWISLDNFNTKRDDKPGSTYSSEWYTERLAALKNAGLLNQILISHDAGWYRPDEKNGGEIRGYTGIFTHLIPTLKEQGFTQSDIDQLLIINPQKAFVVRNH